MDVTKMVDPVTKKDIYTAPAGYDATKEDDAHSCSDTGPNAGSVTVTPVIGSPNDYTISGSVTNGSPFKISSVEIKVGGSLVKTLTKDGNYSYVYSVPASATSTQPITVTVTDTGYYVDVATGTMPAYTPLP